MNDESGGALEPNAASNAGRLLVLRLRVILDATPEYAAVAVPLQRRTLAAVVAELERVYPTGRVQ